MTTILEHALRHVQSHGMSAGQAQDFLAYFARGQGADIGWEDQAPHLTNALAGKIDAAAARWLTNPANAPKPPTPTVREFRDRKRAAGNDPEAA